MPPFYPARKYTFEECELLTDGLQCWLQYIFQHHIFRHLKVVIQFFFQEDLHLLPSKEYVTNEIRKNFDRSYHPIEFLNNKASGEEINLMSLLKIQFEEFNESMSRLKGKEESKFHNVVLQIQIIFEYQEYECKTFSEFVELFEEFFKLMLAIRNDSRKAIQMHILHIMVALELYL